MPKSSVLLCFLDVFQVSYVMDFKSCSKGSSKNYVTLFFQDRPPTPRNTVTVRSKEKNKLFENSDIYGAYQGVVQLFMGGKSFLEYSSFVKISAKN